jgi:hypothetical protein
MCHLFASHLPVAIIQGAATNGGANRAQIQIIRTKEFDQNQMMTAIFNDYGHGFGGKK